MCYACVRSVIWSLSGAILGLEEGRRDWRTFVASSNFYQLTQAHTSTSCYTRIVAAPCVVHRSGVALPFYLGFVRLGSPVRGSPCVSSLCGGDAGASGAPTFTTV